MAVLRTQKCTRAKLTSTQKAEQRQKLANLTNAIETARDAYQEEVQGISQDYGRSLKWTRAQLNGGHLTRQWRKASSWNALVSIKLNEANETRGPGECTMEKEWLAIHAHTLVEGFYIAVWGDLEHYHEVKIFITAKAKSFIKDVLHFEPKHLTLKFESWAFRDFVCAEKNIQDGLDNILQKHQLTSRKRFMRSLINGWTYEKNICNPGKIGCRECLIILLDASVTNKCRWDVLTDEELSDRISNNHKRQANGEKIYKPRKARQPHAINSAKSAQTVCDTDSEDEGQDNEQDNEQENEQENTCDMNGVKEMQARALGKQWQESENIELTVDVEQCSENWSYNRCDKDPVRNYGGRGKNIGLTVDVEEHSEEWSYSGDNNKHRRRISIQVYCTRSDKDPIKNDGRRGEIACSSLETMSKAVQLAQVTADVLRILLVGGFIAIPYELVMETGTWYYY
ncbi:uncharacterized protein EDB91DRAFT_1083656 [Suillus paluster]|uniref:uncharacterized protein n=1 Tax=Suillus paluster TaxID=48578 RepID=UPI001B88133E|nr:uncharacterized protein EDB91DRAFT_1083656 [Suillus paluster]KAG1735567.1 hypothetical protein EDB91DRAFT_1083656 [Suillus paluster]